MKIKNRWFQLYRDSVVHGWCTISTGPKKKLLTTVMGDKWYHSLHILHIYIYIYIIYIHLFDILCVYNTHTYIYIHNTHTHTRIHLQMYLLGRTLLSKRTMKAEADDGAEAGATSWSGGWLFTPETCCHMLRLLQWWGCKRCFFWFL